MKERNMLPLMKELLVIDANEDRIIRKFKVPADGRGKIPKRVVTFATRVGNRTRHCIVVANPIAYF